MILTGENWSTGRKTLYNVGGRWMNEYRAMAEWYWQGKPKYWDRNLSQWNLIHRKTHTDGLGIEAGSPPEPRHSPLAIHRSSIKVRVHSCIPFFITPPQSFSSSHTVRCRSSCLLLHLHHHVYKMKPLNSILGISIIHYNVIHFNIILPHVLNNLLYKVYTSVKGIKNVYRPSCKVPVILVRLSWNLNLLDRLSKNTKKHQISWKPV